MWLLSFFVFNKLQIGQNFFYVNQKAFVKTKLLYIIDNTSVISLTYIFVGV